MSERLFHTQLRDAKNRFYPEAFFYKIPDAVPGDGSRFIPQKPFDAILFCLGQGYAIEYKSHRTRAKLTMALRKSQHSGLRAAQVAGMKALVVVYLERDDVAAILEYSPNIDGDYEYRALIGNGNVRRIRKVKIGRAMVWDFPALL